MNNQGASLHTFADHVLHRVHKHTQNGPDAEDIASNYDEYTEIGMTAEGNEIPSKSVRQNRWRYSAHYEVRGAERQFFKVCSAVDVQAPMGPKKAHTIFAGTQNLMQKAASEVLGRDNIKVSLLEVHEGACGFHYSQRWIEKTSTQAATQLPATVMVQSWALKSTVASMVSMFSAAKGSVMKEFDSLAKKVCRPVIPHISIHFGAFS